MPERVGIPGFRRGRRYIAIETGVQSLLARQTPVAADLRFVLAVLRVNLHLERMADYCVTIAKLVKLTAHLPQAPSLIGAFEEMVRRYGEAGVNEFIVDAPGPDQFAILERVATDVVPRLRARR